MRRRTREDESIEMRETGTPDTLRLTPDRVSRAHVAQLVEHVLGKDEVTRSIRVVGSTQSVLDSERAR